MSICEDNGLNNVKQTIGDVNFDSDANIIHLSTAVSLELVAHDENRLLLLNDLGRGRFSKVIRVRFHDTKQEYAAKIQRWRRQGTVGSTMRNIIDMELAILQLVLGQPCFVQLQGFLNTQKESIILLELCSGGSLADIIQKDNFSLSTGCIKSIGLRLFSALDFLHNHSIVHLDVKPGNLLVRGSIENLDICLCDFGISKKLSSDLSKEIVTFNGTPDFCAPEILAFDPISTACDMWSAGAVLFQLCTGVSPFAPDISEPKELVFARVATLSCDWSLLAEAKVSPSCIDIIKKLLVKLPKKRLTAKEACSHSFLTQ